MDDLARGEWVDERDVEYLRNDLRERIRLLADHSGEPEGRRRLRAAMLRAERRMLVRLRNEGAISDDVLRDLEQELDLEAVRVGVGEER
jgi:monovalent cation/hydrogen antiporter